MIVDKVNNAQTCRVATQLPQDAKSLLTRLPLPKSTTVKMILPVCLPQGAADLFNHAVTGHMHMGPFS